MRIAYSVLALLLVVPVGARAGGVPLLDASGAAHGSVKVVPSRGLVQLKIVGLATLPAAVTAPGAAFTAHEYKAYLVSSTDPAVEIYLADVYPSAKQRATRRLNLGGDVSRLGLDRVVVTAFSKNGQDAFDVLTATFTP